MSYQIKDIIKYRDLGDPRKNEKDEVMLEFIKLNPYPSYSCIEEKMSSFIKKCPEVLNWLSEFSDENYKLSKDIYENPTNEKLIRQCGQKIYNRGGEEAMRAIFYILCNFMPSSFSENPVIRFYLRKVEFIWDGIGRWRC